MISGIHTPTFVKKFLVSLHKLPHGLVAKLLLNTRQTFFKNTQSMLNHGFARERNFSLLKIVSNQMTDVHDKATRSYNMSQIKGINTKPEMLVRKYQYFAVINLRLRIK
ncbi:MAG TPA: hypothetical protein VJ917_04110 [Saprospiraceae bacterium]|nr:hypothetical protein [Saprospiraceae bacterium]